MIKITWTDLGSASLLLAQAFFWSYSLQFCFFYILSLQKINRYAWFICTRKLWFIIANPSSDLEFVSIVTLFWPILTLPDIKWLTPIGEEKLFWVVEILVFFFPSVILPPLYTLTPLYLTIAYVVGTLVNDIVTLC